MFLHLSVILFTGGVRGRGVAWQGACMAGACMAGEACVAGGVHDRRGVRGGGHAWQGRGVCLAGETATAADVMHPTGMHSCVVNPCTVGNLLFWQSLRISECILDTIVF